MTLFEKYAEFYDLLNQEKDYGAESDFIEGLIKKYSPDAGSVLELGCGTGINAVLMAEKGYLVHGVDKSKQMLQFANRRKTKLTGKCVSELTFHHADICDFDSSKAFDVVASLFHVASYQTTNKYLMAMFKTAAKHLKQDGIFLFDFWYGPAVLTDRPYVKFRRFEDERYKIIRMAEPVMNPNKNTVDVNFHFIILDKSTKAVEEFNETHEMRYLFTPEIELMLGCAGFEIKHTGKWMCDEPLGFGSWNGVCVAKRV